MDDIITLADPHTLPTRCWHLLAGGSVQCDVFTRACRLHEGQCGLCFVQARVDDQIVLRSLERVLRGPRGEEAAQPLPARQRCAVVRHRRLQPGLQVLPELGHLQVAGDRHSGRLRDTTYPRPHGRVSRLPQRGVHLRRPSDLLGVRRETVWTATELGTDMPLHFSAFHPGCTMLDVPHTPPATLREPPVKYTVILPHATNAVGTVDITGTTTSPSGGRIPAEQVVIPGQPKQSPRISWCINERALGVVTPEVGAGKTVAIRAALAGLERVPAHTIYLGNPAVGGRGLCSGISTALGGVPRPQVRADPANLQDARRRGSRTRPHRRPGPGRSPPPGNRSARRAPAPDQCRYGLPLTIRVSGPAHAAQADQARHVRCPGPTDRVALRDNRDVRARDQKLLDSPR